LGVTAVIVGGTVLGFSAPSIGVIGAAFVGGVAAVLATLMVSRGVGQGSSTTVVILAGVAVAAFASSIQTYIQQRHIDTVARVYVWMLGNLNVTNWMSIFIVAVVAGLCAALIMSCARLLDVMAVGDVEARTLGVDPGFVRIGIV